jgi:hypothetical protein
MIKNTPECKKIIVSYASKGRADYNIGQQKLYQSILEHWDGDYWLHSKERDGILPDPLLFKHREHNDVPYFFKFTMIQLAREKGYTEAGWGLIGFFFSFIALIAIAGMPDLIARRYLRRLAEALPPVEPNGPKFDTSRTT